MYQPLNKITQDANGIDTNTQGAYEPLKKDGGKAGNESKGAVYESLTQPWGGGKGTDNKDYQEIIANTNAAEEIPSKTEENDNYLSVFS